MGTRSRTEVFQGDSCLVSIYRHMDGYPTGHGADLVEFLGEGKIVNGAHNGGFNGLGDLAAALVWFLKKDGPNEFQSGGIYLHAPMVEDGESGEEYVYRISGDFQGPLTIQVTEGDVTAFGAPNDPASFKGIFSGTVAEFAAWVAGQK